MSKLKQTDTRKFQTPDGIDLPTEFWIVIFFDEIPGPQYKVYGRVGTLINAVEDHFGWAYVESKFGKKGPDYHIWHVDIAGGSVTPVEGPLWRPK
jgi:hypothetical protein